MNAAILRFETSEKGMLGLLQLRGTFFCFTFERDHDDPLYKPISIGDYRCEWHVGPKWETWEVMGVPGRSEVLFHIGNHEQDSKGCILVGLDAARDGVLNSREAFRRLLAATKGETSFPIKIREYFL